MRRTLEFLARGISSLVWTLPVPIVLCSIVVAGASAWLAATRLRVINDTDAIIRPDSPIHRNYLQYKNEFQAEGDYVVVVRSNDPEKNREVAQKIGEALKQMSPPLRRVLYRLDFSRLEDRFLLFLDTDDLRQIEKDLQGYLKALRQPKVRLNVHSMLDQANARFSEAYLRKAENWKEFKPFIDQFIAMLNRLADTVEGRVTVRTPVASPAESKASKVAQAKLEDFQRLKTENEFISFDQGRIILVLASPPIGAQATDENQRIVHRLRQVLATIQTQNPQVHIGLTGEPVLAADELETSSQDTIRATGIAFALVALLYVVAYGELWRPLVAIVVLVLALCGSLGFATLAIGHLNLISEAFVAMVVGLGIDFGIQIMSRYEEELALGRSLRDALDNTLRHTGVAILTGGATTAVAFFSMCFNDFIGLAEFGAVAGAGVLFCLVGNLIVLPAAYILRDRGREPHKLQTEASRSHWAAGPFVHRILFSFPWGVLAAAAVASWLAWQYAQKVTFDYNLLHLQNPKLESVQEELSLLQSPANSVVVAVSVANDLEEAKKRVEQFKKLPTVRDLHSLTEFFPEKISEKQALIRRIVQRLKGARIQTDVRSQINVARVRRDLASLLEKSREGYREAKKYTAFAQQARDAVEVFSKLIPPLERALAAMEQTSQEELGRRLNRYQIEVFGAMQRNLAWLASQKVDRPIGLEDLPVELLERYRSPSGRILIEISPKESPWDHQSLARFVKDLRTIDPNVTGTPVENYEYIELLRKAYLDAARWALIVVAILVAIHFLHPGYILLTLLPLGLGSLWALGIVGLAQIPFNPANIITLPLVLGIGVAYGIYAVDRYQEEGRMNLFSTSTGKAILLSAFTALIGFGSLLVSTHRGLYSIGLLMLVGIGSCLVTSLWVLPQILCLLDRWRLLRKQPTSLASDADANQARPAAVESTLDSPRGSPCTPLETGQAAVPSDPGPNHLGGYRETQKDPAAPQEKKTSEPPAS